MQQAGNPNKPAHSHTEAMQVSWNRLQTFLETPSLLIHLLLMCVQGRMYLPSTSTQHSALLWLCSHISFTQQQTNASTQSAALPPWFFYLLQQAQSKQPFVAETTGVNSLSSAYSEVHLLLTYLFAAPALLSVYLSLPSWWLWSPGSAEPFSKMGWWLYPVIPGREPVMIFQSAFPPFPFQDGKKSFYSSRLFSGCFKGLFIWRGSCLAGDERCFCGQHWQRAGGCEEGSKEERMESLEEAMLLSGFVNPAQGLAHNWN